MSKPPEMSTGLVQQLRQMPVHAVLVELCQAGRDAKLLASAEFQKLAAYLLELADGRDRREPWTSRPGVARPVPKLRVAVEKCFGVYADLHWFRLNKTTNSSGQPLTGLFPRMAASLSRIQPRDFGLVIRALLTSAPDAALLRLLNEREGKIRGMGVEAFSRLAYALRRDLYFVISKPWGETSGCLKYIGDDLRKYCGLCRNLRAVCDDVGFPADVRGSMLEYHLRQAKPPAVLLEALHKAIGSSLAKYSALEPSEAYEPARGDDDETSLPMEFAARAIRARRGRRDLREAIIRAYGHRCAMTGRCVRDLLEVAYIVPYPTGDVHAPDNALLLRSDLHTLWDLNLIGVEPATLRIHVAPKLVRTSYEQLAGRLLLTRADGSQVSGGALKERWRMFEAAHGTAVSEPASRPAPERHRAEAARSEPEAPQVEILRPAEEPSERAGR